MPEVGGRTPTTNTAPRTPSTDSGVCAISPSDLVGYTGNALNRIKDLEQRVAELEAANVEVNQLSDLSQQIGWVGGITYMGIPGWTQTEYGTLIPPAGVSLSSLGFTMSDGNQYPFVVTDENGVLQFGFDTSGNVSGASSPSKSYIVLNTPSAAPGANISWGGTSAVSSDGVLSFNGTTTVTISQTGVYAYGLILRGTSADINDNETFIASQTFGWPFTHSTAHWAGVVDEDGKFYVGATVIGVVTAAPSTFTINWSPADDPGASLDHGSLTIVKIARLG
jgi:hypothetical protein